MISLLLLVVTGFFLGGVYSFWRQDRRGLAVGLAVFALLSLAAAVLWRGA